MEIVINKLPLFLEGDFECVKQLLFDATRCQLCKCVSMLKKAGDKMVCYKCKDYWLDFYDEEEYEDTVIINDVGFRAFNDCARMYRLYVDDVIEFKDMRYRFVYFNRTDDKFKTFAIRTLVDKLKFEKGVFTVILKFGDELEINKITQEYLDYYIDLN